MNMTKAEIITFIQDLTQSQADSVTLSGYFDQLLDDLGRIPNPPLIELEVIAAVLGTTEYTLPDNAICELAVFYDDRELSRTTAQQLEARSLSWRDHSGKPWAYIKDDSTARTIKLYPAISAAHFIATNTPGIPMGTGIPSNPITIIYASRANDKIPNYLALPITLQILSWEFARPSKHQSESFASLCQELSDLLFSLLGITHTSGEKK